MLLSKHIRTTVFINRVREEALIMLTASGFATVGKDPTPIPNARALQMLRGDIDPETVYANLPEVIGSEEPQQLMQAYNAWLDANTDKIKEAAKGIISVLAFVNGA